MPINEFHPPKPAAPPTTRFTIRLQDMSNAFYVNLQCGYKLRHNFTKITIKFFALCSMLQVVILEVTC